MLYSDFYNDFLTNYDNKDLDGSITSLMSELGNIIATNRGDFEDLLSESGVEGALNTMTDSQLVNAYINEISNNKDLQLGSSMLINHYNKESNMDGDNQMNDACVKAGYHTLAVYFANPSENYYNATGEIGAIAQGLGEIAKYSGKLSDAKQRRKYGAIDMATKRQEAKDTITQQLLAQKQAQLEVEKTKKESNAKTMRTLLLVGGGIVAIGIIGYLVFKLKKK
jgi:preprotein translocase subunit Sss1